MLIWAALLVALLAPVAIAAASPLLAWRDPVYIAAGFAGVIAMSLLLLQPLLVSGYLPGAGARLGRRLHQWGGAALAALIILHVGGLWLTSPPDVIDALLFRSPTAFSGWGVVAMWGVFAAALLAVFRRKLRPLIWRLGHITLAILIVVCSIVHALLIEGAMETTSKAALCALAGAALVKLLLDLWPQIRRMRRLR